MLIVNKSDGHPLKTNKAKQRSNTYFHLGKKIKSSESQ